VNARRFFTWRKIALTVLVVIGIAGIYTAYSLYHTVHVVIPHSYAAWTTGDLLIEFLETHTNQWPRSWKDLSEARDSLQRKGRNVYWEFDRLPAIVRVDWNAEPPELLKRVRANGETSLKVVTQADGSRLEAVWGPDTEPNHKLARYLLEQNIHSQPTNK
jgi:hypothetical protein